MRSENVTETVRDTPLSMSDFKSKPMSPAASNKNMNSNPFTLCSKEKMKLMDKFRETKVPLMKNQKSNSQSIIS